jgi:SAM-dependent methyltransferase
MDATGLRFLMELHRRAAVPAKGSVAEIGAQELFVQDEPAVLREFLVHFGAAEAADDEFLAALAQRGAARRLFERAGWKYICIDTSAEFDAVVLDLNYDRVPWRHRAGYDLVTNFGCTEHIANQLNAFKAIHDLVKPGGLMVHAVPCQGFVDHGLFNYSAKFFWRLAEYNSYRAVDMRLTNVGGSKPVPESFNLTFSVVDRSAELRDSILWIALQKTHREGFVPLFDGALRSQRLSRRYPRTLVEKYNAMF